MLAKFKALSLKQLFVLMIINLLLIGAKRMLESDCMGLVEDYKERNLKFIYVFDGYQYCAPYKKLELFTFKNRHTFIIDKDGMKHMMQKKVKQEIPNDLLDEDLPF